MTTKQRLAPGTAPDSVDLASWKQRLDDLPDLRWEKIVRIREALRKEGYEVEKRINHLRELVENDVGVLCRRENLLAEDPLADPAPGHFE